jgi:transcriptional regulator with XRE-family HTH domain
MDLKAFGQILRELRKKAGLTQAQLTLKLSVGEKIISTWERAYEHKGRIWRPDRESVVRLVEILADYLTPEKAQLWAGAAGYQLRQAELQKLFPAYAAQLSLELPPPPKPKTNFKRLIMPPQEILFGIDLQQRQLSDQLNKDDEPWLIAIDGIGGIGKTALANAMVHETLPAGRFYDAAWLSAKQEEFRPNPRVQKINQPALDRDTLVDTILEQLGDRRLLVSSSNAKLDGLINLLRGHPYLIVIDNLETIADYQALLPVLRKLANPSKFLLTSRHNLRAHSDVFCLNLTELSWNDTFAFLMHEAEVRGISILAEASEVQLESIYRVVGGNPLALKLVVGQIGFLPLSEVLRNLEHVRDKEIDDLYCYIYWQAWRNLDAASQKALLAMPLAQGGTLNQLRIVSRLEMDKLNQALKRLIIRSLVEVQGSIEQRRYHIHRLTETFLLTEIVKKW